MSGTIYCVGRNYAAHAAELGNQVPTEPLIFLKAASVLRGLDPEPVAFPDETFHHEAELVVRLGHEVPLGGQAGWSEIDAITMGLDLTRREVQSVCKEKRVPWTTAKSFAGSGVLAPWIPMTTAGPPPYTFSLRVNETLRQQGTTENMVFSVPALLSYLAHLAPLRPGDLVFTGTPEGVGPLAVGDRFELRLAGGDGFSERWNGTL